MTTIAIATCKGGVGKTTTAVTLAAALASRGRTVLLVDLDPRGYATLHLGCSAEGGSLSEVMTDGRPLVDVVVPTQTLGVMMVPGDLDLASAAARVLTKPGRELLLRRAFERANLDVDYVILDCPPEFSMLGINALAASDYYIVPVATDEYSIRALEEYFHEAEEIREVVGGGQCLGVLLTNVDYRTRVARTIERELREHLGDRVLNTVIRQDVRLREAISERRSVLDTAPRSVGARAYAALAAEVEERIR
jgi:chromosome partitioning protein